MIGQNGLMLLDKMAQHSGVEKCACREFNTCKERGIKGNWKEEKRKKGAENLREERKRREERKKREER